MSERQISAPEFAALVFRIVGVVILLSGIAQGLFTMLVIAEGGWSFWNLFGMLFSLFFIGAIALPLIFRSEALVRWVFPESERTIGLPVSRRDLLMCGLALVGAWILATDLPYVARVAGQLLWNLEGTRRSQMGPELVSQAMFDALGSVFAAVAGWLLFRYSDRIADWWEAKSAPPGSR